MGDFSAAISDRDNWMCLNAQCSACAAPMVTISVPMSARLENFECGDCGEMSVQPFRLLMVCGIPTEGAEEPVTIKSLECESLEAMYQTQSEEDGK